MSFAQQSSVGSPGRSGAYRAKSGPAVAVGLALCLVLVLGGGGQARGDASSVPYPQAPTRTAGKQITVGSIPLTIAPGWKITEQNETAVIAASGNGSVAFTLEDVRFDPGISKEEIMAVFWHLTTKNWTKSDHQTAYDPNFTGKRFQESLAVNFDTNVQTDRGSADLVGVLVVMLNPTTGDAGLVKYLSEPRAYDAYLQDAIDMTASTLD